jgi:hypothetical protein
LSLNENKEFVRPGHLILTIKTYRDFTPPRPRKFRAKLDQWLRLVRTMWTECPARAAVIVNRAIAILPRENVYGCA